MKKRNRSYLFLSLIFSIGLHLFFAYLLQCSGVLISQGNKENKSFVRQEERDYLKTVFDNVAIQHKSLEKPLEQPKLFLEKSVCLLPHKKTMEEYVASFTDFTQDLKDKKIEEKHFIKQRETLHKPLFAQTLMPKDALLQDSFEKLAKKVNIIVAEKGPNNNLPTPIATHEKECFVPSLSKPTLIEKKNYTFEPLLSFKSQDSFALEKGKRLGPEKGKIEIQKKKFGFFKLKDLSTESCSEDFDTDLVFFPKEDGDGYVFALTLIPKPCVDFPKIKQNYFFLLDRSNGIGSKRFHVTQGAILKALTHLSEADTFNILAFDNQVRLLSPCNMPFGKQGLGVAKKFLDGISIGTIFSSSNVVTPLYSVLSYPSHEDDINVAILLTNGDGVAEVFNNRLLVEEWSLQNAGKVSLYSLSLTSDVQNVMMQMFSAFNKGKVLTSSTLYGIKRQLIKLMQQIKHPIAKDVQFTAVSKDNGKPIELFTYLKPPHLYKDDPYVIMGSVKTLDDFVLFVQGKRNGSYLNIKKNISFVNATTAQKRLKKDWAMQLAFEKYQSYIYEKDPKYLTEMRKILTPYDIEASFQ